MLMFVFGAGASYDSDPDRPTDEEPLDDFDFRPPLAAGLFAPNNRIGKEAIAAFPRSAPLMMRLREATRQGEDIEEVLEQIAVGSDVYPGTATQLLAFRAYLAQLMSQVPDEWADECQGLTNYVLTLEQADRWNQALHGSTEPVICVTFNYDSLLERAVRSVFGHRINHIDQYASHPLVHVFKPHGSVNWQRAATWDQPENHWISKHGGLSKAINEAASLDWSEDFRFQSNDEYQDRSTATKVWLPALSIPVRNKAEFTMPDGHMAPLCADLRKVTTVVAVGWRARERHFLRLLQDNLGGALVRLVAGAETDQSAQETVDNLWMTGRFTQFAVCGTGFSGFTEIPREPAPPKSESGGHTPLTLHHVLTAGGDAAIWKSREPSNDAVVAEDPTWTDPGYRDL